MVRGWRELPRFVLVVGWRPLVIRETTGHGGCLSYPTLAQRRRKDGLRQGWGTQQFSHLPYGEPGPVRVNDWEVLDKIDFSRVAGKDSHVSRKPRDMGHPA